MLRKTQRNFRRRVKTWPERNEHHNELVLRETWWLFGILPLYSRETIEKTNI